MGLGISGFSILSGYSDSRRSQPIFLESALRFFGDGRFDIFPNTKNPNNFVELSGNVNLAQGFGYLFFA